MKIEHSVYVRMCDALDNLHLNDTEGRTLKQCAEDAMSRFVNSQCEFHGYVTIWDSRGHWWTDEKIEEFLKWINEQ